MGPALGAEEADVGDVVLPAGVGAAGDVGADAADLGQAGLVEGGTDGVGEAAAWVTARLQVSAPGQATTSRDSSAPGWAMSRARSWSNSSGSCCLAQARRAKFSGW